MSEPERRLFDIDKVAPVVPLADRYESFRRGFRRVGLMNALDDVKDAIPIATDRLAGISEKGGTIVMHGVEVNISDIGAALEA